MSNFILTLDPLKDSEFLMKLDRQPHKETFARVTALTWEETPIEYIEGRITGGTISIDGSSAVRRTCSLSMVAQNIDINSFYWGLNSKVKIELGVVNTIDSRYPEIIWFPQGLFVLTTFNTSVSTNSYSISLSGKDKMCLLNGDVGGSLDASIDFGTEEYVDLETNTTTYYQIPIREIIKNAVHVYGQEPLHNIVIRDLDRYGYELLDYKGADDSPLYLFRNKENDIYYNMTMNKNQPCFYWNGSKWISTIISDEENIKYLIRVEDLVTDDVTDIKLKSDSSIIYNLCKITSNETVGYRLTDLTYAGDLISNVGESLTSILDKIKNMLGNFEYFYDLDGRFVFQQKKNNIYSNWNPLQETEDGTYVDPYASQLAYTFYDSHFFTSVSHTPNLTNLKNDFSIWGVRESVNGAEIPVHMRYALDRKPERYTSIAVTEEEAENLVYDYGFDVVKSQKSVTYTIDNYNWREIIYQMALDYFLYNKLDDFEQRVAEFNPDDYPTGRTGYEIYYTDMQGFWRQLYNPTPDEDELENYYTVADGEKKKYWNKDVDTNPTVLNFWFDFLGEGTEMDKYLVPAIGHRTKAVNDKDIKAIYFEETPDVLFITSDEYDTMVSGAIQTGYTYIRINDSLNGFFNISAQGKSAHDKLEELLYENTYCTETISVNSIPIYYLEPNIRIGVKDAESNIDGEYIISRISLPLTYNGTMQITATKAADTLY